MTQKAVVWVPVSPMVLKKNLRLRCSADEMDEAQGPKDAIESCDPPKRIAHDAFLL